MYNINKKTWKLLLAALITTLLVFLFPSTTISLQNYTDRLSSDTNLDTLQNPQDKMAFVTFLCDDIMGEATEVLVYSLQQTQTKHDIVILVLDDVTAALRQRLEFLGAKIINVDQIKYPWDSSSARRKGFNKACRYSKLNLWNLTQYKKVVFLDADTMVVNPIDELFEYPQFTAAVDIGGVLNTGVFVAEPSVDTYKDIMSTYENAPSYNKGDQGFLNYYFNQSAHNLPGNYNVMIKFTHFSSLASNFITQNTVKVLHYTSETKPWNFYFLHQREWRENYDGHLFGLWTRTLRNMRKQLTEAGLWKSELDLWENKGRVALVCDKRIKATYGRKYPNVSQFTVILNFSRSSVDISYLKNLLRMYASSKKVAQIFIHGSAIKDENGKTITLNSAYLKSLKLRKPTKVVPRDPFVSVNSKFNPIQGITTNAVFLADEDVLTSLEDLEFGFEIWNKNQEALVGYKSSAHSLSKSTQEFDFIDNLDESNQYSMIESNSMFLKSDFLHAYTCLLPQEIHYYVDQHPICLDIAMNMLASGMTGASPVLLNASLFFKFESTLQNSISEQSQCINDLSILFNNQNPLLFSNSIVFRVSKVNTIEAVPWNTWTEAVASIKSSSI